MRVNRIINNGDQYRPLTAKGSNAAEECAWPAIPIPGNRLDGGRAHPVSYAGRDGWRRAGRRCGQHDSRLRNRQDRPWRPHAFSYLSRSGLYHIGLGVSRVLPQRLSKGKCIESTCCTWPFLASDPPASARVIPIWVGQVRAGSSHSKAIGERKPISGVVCTARRWFERS